MPFPRDLPKKRRPVNYKLINLASGAAILWTGCFLMYMKIYNYWPRLLSNIKPHTDPNDPEYIREQAMMEQAILERKHKFKNFYPDVSPSASRITEENIKKGEVGLNLRDLLKNKEYIKNDTLPSGQFGSVVFSTGPEKESHSSSK